MFALRAHLNGDNVGDLSKDILLAVRRAQASLRSAMALLGPADVLFCSSIPCSGTGTPFIRPCAPAGYEWALSRQAPHWSYCGSQSACRCPGVIELQGGLG